MFPWMSFPPPSEWMWAKPRAAPSKIFNLESQSRGVLLAPVLLFPAEVVFKRQPGGMVKIK